MATKTSNILVWIILGLLIVGLVGFGSTNFGSSVRSVGTVGDTDISADAYFRELTAEVNAFEQTYGTRLSAADIQAFGYDQMVLERVIAQTALQDETARLGLSVGDQELAQRIGDIQAFQGVDGTFNRDTYDFVLAQSGLTSKEFVESLRTDVARTIVQKAVTDGVGVQPVYTDTLFSWARETRDFTWAKLTASALTDALPAPTEDDLQAYYDANPAAFTAPESKRITYAWLSPDAVIGTIEVSEDDLRTLYDERKDSYLVPERRLVERLVFGSREDAQAAADAIASGEKSFEDVVAERGLSLTDIDLGDVTEKELGAAGVDIFALNEPGVTGPFDSDLGPAIFRMNGVLAAQETTFEEAEPELRDELAADRARRHIDEMSVEMEDELAGGATLEEIAATYGMEIAQIDWTADNSDGIAAYEAFRNAAATVTEDDYPEMAMLDDGGTFALRLDEVVAAHLLPLDEVRDAVTQGWRAEATVAALETRAAEMIESFANGESPATQGLAEVAETGQSRQSFIDGTPDDLIDTVFAALPGDGWQTLPDSDGVVIFRLDAVRAPDHATDEARQVIDAFSAQAAQAMGSDILDAFSKSIEDSAGITLDQAMLQAVLTSLR